MTNPTQTAEVKSPREIGFEHAKAWRDKVGYPGFTMDEYINDTSWADVLEPALSAAISQAVRVTKERVEKYKGNHLTSCEKSVYNISGNTCTCGFLSLESDIIKELTGK